MYGNGMPRIDRQRREHGEDPLVVERGHRLAVVRVELGPRHDADSGRRQRRDELVDEDRFLTLDQPIDAFADLDELLGRRPSVGCRVVDAGRDLVLQGGDTDLEELVEVDRADRAELGPFEQRDARLRGERQAPGR